MIQSLADKNYMGREGEDKVISHVFIVIFFKRNLQDLGICGVLGPGGHDRNLRTIHTDSIMACQFLPLVYRHSVPLPCNFSFPYSYHG